MSNQILSNQIHHTAIVHPSAKIAANVEIGPYSVIGPEVEIGVGTWIGPHVVINGPSKIGRENKFFQFCSVGEAPQDLSYKGEPTRLEMGDRNVVREYASIQRGTIKASGITKIGNDNLFMTYSHIAHDCIVHNKTIFSSNAVLAGHVEVQDSAIIGAFCAVHQFSRIGAYAFVTRSCLVPRDVPPYLLIAGHVAKVSGLNIVGLRRHGFSLDTIKHLRRAYKALYWEDLNLEQAMEKLTEIVQECPEVQLMIDFIKEAEKGRGIVRVAGEEVED